MPQVTYKTPSGQTITSELQDAPPQIQTLYNQNYLQPQASVQQTQTSTAATGAQIPGIQAESGIKQIQQQQVGALQNLGRDLSSKMTLGEALKKYTPLG